MRRSYYELYVHTVWSTKNREPYILEKYEPPIIDIITAKCIKHKVTLLAIGNTDDHIHLLLSIHPRLLLADFIGEIKGASSHFINHNANGCLYWQDGYGALSLSKKALPKVIEYVEHQKDHHQNPQSLIEELEKMETED
jgi:putative transposase